MGPRWIDKAGGLDEYLIRTSDAKLGSELGSRLKEKVWKSLQRQRDAGNVDLYKLKMAAKPPRIKPRAPDEGQAP